MKTDSELKRDVEAELKWDASINEAEIGVAVKDSIVTLTGYLSTYAEKIAAEKATKRVLDVKAVVQEIEVKISSSDKRSDVDIAKAALDSLKWDVSVPKDGVLVKVANGWVTLEGSVKWNFQKTAAKKAVQNLKGVRGVTNIIAIKSAIEPSKVKENIKKTFERNATLDSNEINVSVDGHKVTLTGNVKSLDEEKQAKAAAWSAPGVWEVVDNLNIRSRELATSY
jgi:osmotically-inducible protein OsmY